MAEPLMIRGRPLYAPVAAMLATAGLPTEDLCEAYLDHFFYAGSNASPTGLVGLEIYGPDALLRSLLVEERERGRGLGMALVRHAEAYAALQGVRSIYLLTVTAEPFFHRLAYARLDRGVAPPSIQRTSEFASLCPASSAFMVKRLYTEIGAL
jgi:amino-acid N-acetyltransferase